jgi:hypothetical protein
MRFRFLGVMRPKLSGAGRATTLASVAVLAVGLSGGAALASDSSQAATAQIHACYKSGQNPSGLELLTKGSCPKGFSAVTWNVKGPAGPRGATGATGATGAQGPAGPAGIAGPQGAPGTTGLTGASGPQGPAGPQGPTGTFGSITTVSDTLAVGPDEQGELVAACATGSVVISGGVSYGTYTPGVTIVTDAPNTASGTPTSWLAIVANAGTTTVTMTDFAVCATPAGTAGSSAQASKGTQSAQKKGVIVALPKARATAG